MQIFLSYASEDREIADQVHLALAGAGHQVFFDKESLPPGGDYHARIRNAVERSDILVFLISPSSVVPGSYALTELKYARAKWSHPKGRVLPARVQDVSWDAIPAYLKAVTVLEPEGNLSAEVVVAVSEMTQETGQEQRPTAEAQAKKPEGQFPPKIERTQKITVPVLVALIGMGATIGAATIANWHKLFPTRPPLPVSTTGIPQPPIPANVATSLHVAVKPDTVGITPNGYHVVKYHFSDSSGGKVIIESQDAQYLLPDGKEVGEPCTGCRILGGSFSIPNGGSYTLIDNVWLPPVVAQRIKDERRTGANLRTVFIGRDESGTRVKATAILYVVPVW